MLGPHRKDIVLATKFGRRMDDAGHLMGGSRRYIFSAIEASLRRLKTDWMNREQVIQTRERNLAASLLGACHPRRR